MHHWAKAEELLARSHTREYADEATADACKAIAHALLALLEALERLARSQETT
jgi:hypothetical protein